MADDYEEKHLPPNGAGVRTLYAKAYRLRAEHWAGSLRISTLLMSLVVADKSFLPSCPKTVKLRIVGFNMNEDRVVPLLEEIRNLQRELLENHKQARIIQAEAVEMGRKGQKYQRKIWIGFVVFLVLVFALQFIK